MADNIKTVGASGADYTTIDAFVADLDDGTNAAINTTAYGSGDVAICELIDASYSNPTVSIDTEGETVGLSKIVFRPATGNKHDGTFGSGCTIAVPVLETGFVLIGDVDVTIEDLIFSGTGSGAYSHSYLIWHQGPSISTVIVQRCLFQSDAASRTVGTPVAVYDTCNNSTAITRVLNCWIRKFNNSPGSNAGTAVRCFYSGKLEIDNCTITGNYNGVQNESGNTASIRNTLITGSTNVDAINTGTWDVATSNITGDGTLTSSTQTYQSTGDLFVNYGSGDITPKAGSDLIDAGTDLTTSPTGVNLDLIGYDRDAGGVTWDVGAMELQASTVSPVPILMQLLH